MRKTKLFIMKIYLLMFMNGFALAMEEYDKCKRYADGQFSEERAQITQGSIILGKGLTTEWFFLNGYAKEILNLSEKNKRQQQVKYKEVAAYYSLAAIFGNPHAQYRLGGLYDRGQGVSQSFQESAKCYRRASEQDHSESQFCLGEMYAAGEGVTQSYTEALKWWLKSALQGNAQAQYNLGVMYERGRGGSVSRIEAEKWYTLAAKQGADRAQYNLGLLYLVGEEIVQSYTKAFHWFLKAGLQGHVSAQLRLGYLYFSGDGVDKSYEESFKWFLKAALQGDVAAQHNVGSMYQSGQGINQSYGEAIKWYERAAAQDSTDSQSNLGAIYLNGWGVEKSGDNARHWFLKSANKGNATAQSNLGTMYYYGQGITQSFTEAEKWFECAAKQGDANAQHCLGLMHSKGQCVVSSPQKAFEWITKAAMQGHAEAQDILGIMYQNGDCVDQSYKKAEEWYTKAAMQGIAHSQFRLGMLYYKGIGVKKSWQKAFKWLSKAAENEDAQAQYNLGSMYFNGWGIKQSYRDAFIWYEKAARAGIAEAQIDVGSMYLLGRGIKQSYEESAKWYMAAAKQNRADAQYTMGGMYENGWGVPQSYEEAFKWHMAAAEQNYPKALFRIGAMYKDGKCGVVQSYEESIRWFKKAAEFGYADAQCNLGAMCLVGQRVEEYDGDAFAWLTNAATQGHAVSQYNLSTLYRDGRGVKQSYEEAFKWCMKAAQQELAEAQYELVGIYAKGLGVAISYADAFKWCMKAAQKGFKNAQHALGLMYITRDGNFQYNPISAMSWFLKAYQQGMTELKPVLGLMYSLGKGVLKESIKGFMLYHDLEDEHYLPPYLRHENQNFGELISYFITLLALPNVLRDFEDDSVIPLFSQMLSEKKEKSVKEAIADYRHAAEHGFPDDQLKLGIIYHYGIGIIQDKARGIEWYAEAAQRGNTQAQHILSRTFQRGFGLADDISQYIRWHAESTKVHDVQQHVLEETDELPESTRSALNLIKNKDVLLVELERIDDVHLAITTHHKGDISTYVRLGDVYANVLISRVPSMTDEDVFNYLFHSAKEGNEKSQYRLGRMYQYGWGVISNHDEAIDYFQLAAKKNYIPAQKAVAEYYRYGIVLEKSDHLAIKWYKRAAKQGDAGATAYIREMADEISVEAIYNLGKAYEEGWGIVCDKEEMMHQYELAAYHNHDKAQYKVALNLLESSPSMVMYEKAIELLTKSAGREARKRYLKLKQRKDKVKELSSISAVGYYKAQQFLADLYQEGKIVSFKTIENYRTAYEEAMTLHNSAFINGGKHLLLGKISQAQIDLQRVLLETKAKKLLSDCDIDILNKAPWLDGKLEDYNSEFIVQLIYIISRISSFEESIQNEIHRMLHMISLHAKKNNQTKISKGLIHMLIREIDQMELSKVSTKATEVAYGTANEHDRLRRLSQLFQENLMERSWNLLELPSDIPLSLIPSSLVFHDTRIDIFNSIFYFTGDLPPEELFRSGVLKILQMYDRGIELGHITQESLIDKDFQEETGEKRYGSRDTLENFLTFNKQKSHFAHRIIRIADILDKTFKSDYWQVIAQLVSWSVAGYECKTRSEEETFQYYLAHLTSSNLEHDDCSENNWSLEVRVALSLAKLREQLIANIVPQNEHERIHQVSYLRKKAHAVLSLLGNEDLDENTIVSPCYESMTIKEITDKIRADCTLDRLTEHLISDFLFISPSRKAEILEKTERLMPRLSKLERRLRFQFLRNSVAPGGELDNTLFKDEDFVLSDACTSEYVDMQLQFAKGIKDEYRSFNWQMLKGKSIEIAQQQLNAGFYDNETGHLSKRGVQSLLYSLKYLESH